MPRTPFNPLFRSNPPKPDRAEIRPYSDEELSDPSIDEKIQKLMKFFDESGIKYDKFEPEIRTILDKKKAYPNYEQFMYVPGQHNTQKWLMAVKEIYYKQKTGQAFKDAVRQVTGSWKKMETYDFLNWLRYYEEGAHMKYKFAQVWYENGQPGYFLHIKPDAQQAATPTVDVDAAREEVSNKEEKRQIIEKQRAKIIGRLDSAEKLLRSPDGQTLAGPELEGLMEAIYSLKKKVQLVNKLSVSTRLYEDMIVRESNVLRRKGFIKAASVLYAVAQTPGADAVLAPDGKASGGAVPPVASPPDPSGAGQSGMPNGYVNLSVNDPTQPNNVNETQPSAPALTGEGPAPTGTAESTPALIPQEPPQPAGIKEFMENMNEGNKTQEDEMEVTDDLEVEDQEQALMVTEAQVAPVAPGGPPPATLEDVPMTDTPAPAPLNPVAPVPIPPEPTPSPAKTAPPAAEEPLEVTEDDIPMDTPTGGGGSALDNKLDDAFESITMEEIVAELEDISTYYKVREMPRRLARLDMMFDSKGISAYFPSLSEAQKSALESNNYVASRIDDILSKVRGSMAAKDIGDHLRQNQEKEKKRKQMRKEQEDAKLEGAGGEKETPQVEMGELAPPAATPAKAPVVPRPLG